MDRTATAAQQDTGQSKAIHGTEMELSVQRLVYCERLAKTIL